MKKVFIVRLTDEDRLELDSLICKGKASALTLTRARILLKADQSSEGPRWSDHAISQALDVSMPTVYRVRKRFAQEGLESALNRKARPCLPRERKLDGRAEAHLVALTCSSPPAGHTRWTLRLLADKLVELEVVDTICHETVRQVLKKTNLSRG